MTSTSTSTEGCSSWTPPNAGSPVWLSIPVLDVVRARNFYSGAFKWTFKPASEKYPETDIAMFTFPDPSFSKLSGGLEKTDPADHRPGKGSSVVYFHVDDVDESLKLIKELGGSTVVERQPEGDMGWIARFSDTEGNVHGVYACKK